MITEARARSRPGGFTLIEVLVAMVLLAVGLLALQGLGLYAVRSLALADRNTQAVAAATQHLEEAMMLIRRAAVSGTPVPGNLSCTLSSGDQLVRTVNLSNGNLPTVTVSFTPESRGARVRTTTLSSSVFLPAALTEPVPDDPCPS